jgi:transposase-like protein
MSQRREFSPQFKVQVVLEALKEDRSQASICREYNISPELLRQWKKLFLERAHLVFTSASNSKEEARIAELERLVGKLTYELTASKKYSVCWAIA